MRRAFYVGMIPLLRQLAAGYRQKMPAFQPADLLFLDVGELTTGTADPAVIHTRRQRYMTNTVYLSLHGVNPTDSQRLWEPHERRNLNDNLLRLGRRARTCQREGACDTQRRRHHGRSGRFYSCSAHSSSTSCAISRRESPDSSSRKARFFSTRPRSLANANTRRGGHSRCPQSLLATVTCWTWTATPAK